MKAIKLFLSIASLSILWSCGGESVSTSNESSPVQVTLASVQLEPTPIAYTSSAFLSAANSSNLSTRMMGTVADIKVSLGDKVAKGTLLMSLFNQDINAAALAAKSGVTAAKAAYEMALNDLNAYRELFKNKSVTPREWEGVQTAYVSAQTRWEQAKAHFEAAEAQKAYTEIRAPFEGTVTNKFINVGDMAQPGMPLLEIQGDHNFELWTSVNAASISKYAIGDSVLVEIHGSDKKWNAVITEMGVSSKNTAGQYRLKVSLIGEQESLLSGMYASIYFKSKERSSLEAIYLPKEAIVEKGQLKGVYVLSAQNTVMLRWLRLGQQTGTEVEVLSGISENETYVLKADAKLYNGAAVAAKK